MVDLILKIVLLCIFIALSIYLMFLNIKTVPTKTNILIGLSLWILGLYIGIGVCSLFK